jgi:hypothetical protein
MIALVTGIDNATFFEVIFALDNANSISAAK